VTFHLGTAAGLSLVHQIDGIATDTVCTVTEDSDPTWSTTVTPTGGQVTITTTPATVAFANTKLFRQTSFVKSSDPASGTAVTDGATITYTLTYANAGNIPADVTITDTVPAGTTLVAGSAGDATVTGSKLTWERTIAAGGSGAVSFRVTVNAGLPDPTTIRNVALLHGDDGDTPSNEVVHPVAHVNISKVVDRDTAEFGDELTYTLFVSNPSAADLTDVVISDAIPSGTTFVSAASGGTCDNPCTRVTWPAVNLAAGDSTERTFVVRINRPVAAADGAIAAAVITNFGEVDPRETPKKPSNEVVTRVTAVLGIKIVKPPVVIPETGPAIPLQSAVLVALGLLVLGGTLTRTARRR
jgi:uncharacterized repeat protein (TIGR01451 family)